MILVVVKQMNNGVLVFNKRDKIYPDHCRWLSVRLVLWRFFFFFPRCSVQKCLHFKKPAGELFWGCTHHSSNAPQPFSPALEHAGANWFLMYSSCPPISRPCLWPVFNMQGVFVGLKKKKKKNITSIHTAVIEFKVYWANISPTYLLKLTETPLSVSCKS